MAVPVFTSIAEYGCQRHYWSIAADALAGVKSSLFEKAGPGD